MSKFLKVLVNTFLIVAILVAAAILIPPLAGVTTTIVDSAAMDTNLPLGSVTYSTNVDVSLLQAGDEVLKENDVSTYAYIIKSGDETTGQYKVVSAADPNGVEEEIYLRNSVPKVAVIVPYIGYIMIAMHSVEGLIIIALVVILMIILFILSELWKPRDDEDDEEDQDAVVNAGLTEESGIDTETIRAAMEANVAAVSGASSDEDAASDEEAEQHLTRAERRALKKARKQAEKEAKMAGDAAVSAAADEARGSDVWNEGTPSGGSEANSAGADGSAGQMDDPTFDISREVQEVLAGRVNTADQVLPEEEVKTDSEPRVTSHTEEIDRMFEELLPGGDSRRNEYAEPDIASPEIPEENPAGAAANPDPVPAAAAETAAPEIPAAPEPEMHAAESIPFNNKEEAPADRFTPTRRLTLTEMLDQAKATGEQPMIVQDDESGVTVLDYSDLL